MSSPSPAPGQPAPAATPPTRWLYAMLGVALALLLFGGWGLWKTFADGGDGTADPARQQARIETLEQQVATLGRSDQISRDANRELQGTQAVREGEISALRADVAFYERFVGSTAQRRGLSVHELNLRPQADGVWHYTATLTQNLNRGAVSSGRLSLSLEGTQDGKLKRLGWSDLRQQENAPGREYSFKYFQQIEGEFLLPEGFTPLRVNVRLAPGGGAAVERAFSWADALPRPANGGNAADGG